MQVCTNQVCTKILHSDLFEQWQKQLFVDDDHQ